MKTVILAIAAIALLTTPVLARGGGGHSGGFFKGYTRDEIHSTVSPVPHSSGGLSATESTSHLDVFHRSETRSETRDSIGTSDNAFKKAAR